eukprot:10228679-Karenia_brevis.AAC.1
MSECFAFEYTKCISKVTDDGDDHVWECADDTVSEAFLTRPVLMPDGDFLEWLIIGKKRVVERTSAYVDFNDDDDNGFGAPV